MTFLESLVATLAERERFTSAEVERVASRSAYRITLRDDPVDETFAFEVSERDLLAYDRAATARMLSLQCQYARRAVDRRVLGDDA